jgi:hypothetical protein
MRQDNMSTGQVKRTVDGQPFVEFGVRGRSLTVTMTSPRVDDQRPTPGVPMNRPGILWRVGKPAPSKPTRVVGCYVEPDGAPATFSVGGLSVDVTFTLTQTDDGFGIGQLVMVGHDGQQLEQDDVDRLPLASLAKWALRAAGVHGTYFPGGYDGAYVDTVNNVTIDSMRVVVPINEWAIHENLVRPLDDDEVVRLDVQGMTSKRRVNAPTDDELRQVVETWQADGERGVADRFHVSIRTARRWVNRARSMGFLEQLPDTDKRKGRRA